MKSTAQTNLWVAIGLAGALGLLSACSSEPSPWTKKQSPWDQRRDSMQAPAADEYKQDLATMDQGGSDVDLGYQAAPVDGYAPGTMDAPTMEAEAMAEPVTAPAAMTPEEDILSQPADYYTIQVIASVDVDRVYKFAEQNQLSIRYVVPTQRDGVTWHVLLLDVYPDYPSARAAMQEVAGTLPTKPWIRKVGSVQNLLR